MEFRIELEQTQLMRIAFTYNLKMSNREEEAEFDTQQTVDEISRVIENLGHVVDRVEVSGPPSKIISRLESLTPDLIFNTAEGKFGRYREAFYPGVFEQLGIPFTGSDSYTCTLTLDKNLTKTMVSRKGVPTPRSLFVVDEGDLKSFDLKFPVMVKPNFEGSSKGITLDSVISSQDSLSSYVQQSLARFPSGLLIEEFIYGRDISVPFIEGVSKKTGGVLETIEYVFEPRNQRQKELMIYDYDLKNLEDGLVSVRTPARVSEEVSRKIRDYAFHVYKILGVRDMGRIDFRLSPEGELYFIEANALPSLEVGAGIYASAAKMGMPDPEDVIGSIIQSAGRRYGLKSGKAKKPTKKLRVGFTYNEKRIVPGNDAVLDTEAEYDSPKTLDAIREAIRSFGHEVIDLEATPELPVVIASKDVDVVFNIAEGIRGRNRESQIPAILELLDIPYTGSDPATLSLALDKGLAKRIVKDAGVLTPKFLLMLTGKEKLPPEMKFPMMVKPVAEGSSKGVIDKSVVFDEKELREVAGKVIAKYRQAALAEEFLTGREFTVGLLGERRPTVLPPMEIVFLNKKDKYPVYSFQYKLDAGKDVRYDIPAKIDEKLRIEMEKTAKKVFSVLGCRDVARIDFRLDSEGRVNFVECNPLPGLTPGWSDLCLIAEKSGMDYRTLVGEILAPAVKRMKEKRKMLMSGNELKG